MYLETLVLENMPEGAAAPLGDPTAFQVEDTGAGSEPVRRKGGGRSSKEGLLRRGLEKALLLGCSECPLMCPRRTSKLTRPWGIYGIMTSGAVD